MESDNTTQHTEKVIDELRKANEPRVEPIRRFFAYAHLPSNLQEISAPFSALADEILKLPASAERSVALRKLLESKDAAVRAALPV